MVHDCKRLPHINKKMWHGLPHLDREPLLYHNSNLDREDTIQVRVICTNTFYLRYTLWERFTDFIYRIYRRYRHERIDF